MRRRLLGALAAVVSVGLVTALAVAGPATTPAGAATTAGTYTWKNVAIGGGGFIPGIIFNQTQPNLVFARTDIGGAYRWNQTTSSWTPLLDWVGQSNWGYNGVGSLGPDPVQPNTLV